MIVICHKYIYPSIKSKKSTRDCGDFLLFAGILKVTSNCKYYNISIVTCWRLSIWLSRYCE